MTELADHLKAFLADPTTEWSIGTYGAIAEFRRDPDEPILAGAPEAGEIVTARGGIRLTLESYDPRPLAWESLSVHGDRWLQEAALLLEARQAAMGRRDRLTELGPDAEALRDEDRPAALFDMGLGAPHVDVCVRTQDEALIATLRAAEGGSLLAAEGGEAMKAIKAASPDRVFRSRLGRIEVYQPIGSTAQGIPTPSGPHTHVLPKLLAAGQTHSANAPIPAGWLTCLSIYPASPLVDQKGAPRARFDRRAYLAFQALLEDWGDPELLAVKRQAQHHLGTAQGPEAMTPPESRAGRAALRIALRQQAKLFGDTALLAAWREVFEPRGPEVIDGHVTEAH